MFKMFSILCIASVMDCRTLYENPPRVFDSRQACEQAAVVKAQQTLVLLEGSEYAHFEVGCELTDEAS